MIYDHRSSTAACFFLQPPYASGQTSEIPYAQADTMIELGAGLYQARAQLGPLSDIGFPSWRQLYP